MNIPDLTKAWAAGFFEGEGSCGLRQNGGNRIFGVLTVEVSQADRAPLEYLTTHWGGPIYEIRPRKAHHFPFFRWVLITNSAVRFMTDILPFVVRHQVREKIELGLAFQAQKLKTHANRTAEYRERQAAFISQMATLNRRGLTEVERAALSARVTPQ